MIEKEIELLKIKSRKENLKAEFEAYRRVFAFIRDEARERLTEGKVDEVFALNKVMAFCNTSMGEVNEKLRSEVEEPLSKLIEEV